MKIVHLLFLLLPAAPSFSQNYFTFIQYGVYRDEFWAPELQFCTYLYGSRYWFQGDSVVNGQVYFKLCSAAIQGNPNAPVFCPPYTVDTSLCSVFALMREDTAARQVFRYDFDTGTEYLLFDFSVTVGDSVTVGYPPETVYVQDAWYENWADGSSRKKLIVNVPDGVQTFWIESLGASNNLWNPASELCICPHGICYQQNGQNLYGDVCAAVVNAGEPQGEYPDLTLYPNPADDFITLQARVYPKGFDRIVIFNMLGRAVLEQRFDSEKANTEIAVQQLPAGFYTVSVWKQGGCAGIKRFQKV